MGSTDEMVAVFIQQQIRLFKEEANTLESKSQSLAADDEDDEYFVNALIQELTNISRVRNPLIPTVSGDHAVCGVPLHPPEQGRYLCVYFGFNVFCIDLKHKNISDDPNQLVQISPIQLLHKGLPLSMGMFKLNSQTYMVGGQEFYGYHHQPNPWNLRLFDFLYRAFHGTERYNHHTFHLSLSSGDALSLGLTPCDFIRPLNKSKVWPIVERIGHKIHVIESCPLAFSQFCSVTQLSHEVLDCQDIARGWVEIPLVFEEEEEEVEEKEEEEEEEEVEVEEVRMSRLMKEIWNHIVVGDRIYARPDENNKSFLVFESKWNKWVLWDYQLKEETRDSNFGRDEDYGLEGRLSSINHVSQILQYNGRARCFAVSQSYGGGGSSSTNAEILYVLIALFPDDDLKMIAKAYLVTPTGQIICFQALPDIFEKFGRAFEGRDATVINVDEHTMCTIVHGFTADLPKFDSEGIVQFADTSMDHFLLISRFNVEEVGGADIDVDLLKLAPAAVEKVFVKVDVKDVYAYRKDVESDPPKCYDHYDNRDYACVSACVL